MHETFDRDIVQLAEPAGTSTPLNPRLGIVGGGQLAKMTALAPSFKVEAFAAVTVPSAVKTARKPGILSSCTFLYSSSSVTQTGSPLRWGTGTGTTSLANFPDFQASAARL